MNTVIRISLIFISFFSLVSCYATSRESLGNMEDIKGEWKISCDDIASSGFIHITNRKNIMEVSHNQIYISFSILKEKEKYLFYLDSPDDLGAGGMRLPWNDFSKVRPIAIVKKIKNDEAYFEWDGFFDTGNNKYYWERNHDFMLQQGDNSHIVLHRCK